LDLRLYHDLHLHGLQRRSGRGKRKWKQARKESRISEEEEMTLMLACMKRSKSHEGESWCHMRYAGQCALSHLPILCFIKPLL
jgi:hypothetical protein